MLKKKNTYYLRGALENSGCVAIMPFGQLEALNLQQPKPTPFLVIGQSAGKLITYLYLKYRIIYGISIFRDYTWDKIL